jgi:hypothetical protein
MKKTAIAMAVAFALLGAGHNRAADRNELKSTLADQETVAVTIYNENLALVKDTRHVSLPDGTHALALREVSAQLRPETAQLRSVSHPNALALVEQNFDFDLLTPEKLLQKYIGRKVRVIKTHPTTGAEKVEEAQVLSATQGVVLKIGDRIETGLPGRIVYDEVPAHLRDRPTLVVQLQNQNAVEQKLELSYLTGGLSWKADYVAELNDDDTRLDLAGWVTLTNLSGTAYRNAKLQLVAGDVNRVKEELRYKRRDTKQYELVKPAAAAPEMKQESLFEYHLYSLNRATTLEDNQTKQVALLNAASVPVKKELLLAGNDYYYFSSVGELGQKMKLGVYVEFENKTMNHLGLPLPKGVVRVYKKDSSGNAQFVGEDRVDHTPKNEKVRLKLGDAFDVTADKKQTDFKRKDGGESRLAVYESAYEIVLKNAKSEPVTVTVQEPIPGDWKMLEQSQQHEKATAHTARWQITVPAEGKATLRYRVQTRH